MPAILRRHRAWKASSRDLSAWFNQRVCRQYISLETTQASNIMTFLGRHIFECLHSLHNVSKSLRAMPMRWLSAAPLPPSAWSISPNTPCYPSG